MISSTGRSESTDGIHVTRIRLDASTACQLKCPSCPTAAGEVGRSLGSGFLKPEDFRSLLDQYPAISEVELSSWGEVFLNPRLLEIFRDAKARGVALNIRNGVNLNTVSEEILEGLVRYGIRKMTCSIDGASPEVYSVYRRGGNFEKVIHHLRRINDYKKQYGSDRPELTWQFVVFGHNEHEIEKARAMAASLGMAFKLKLSWGDLYAEEFSPVRNGDRVRRAAGIGAKDREEFERVHGRIYGMDKVCGQLWNRPQINYDGRVLGCCVNYWGDYGNAYETGLGAILNGEKMKAARQMLLGRTDARPDIPCASCKVYQERKRKRLWLSAPPARKTQPPSRLFRRIRSALSFMKS